MPVMFRARGRWPLAAATVAIIGVVAFVVGMFVMLVEESRAPQLTGCQRGSAPVRFATFNIEEFPRNAGQVEGAFEVIAGLDAGFVAVQEITDPVVFLDEAQRRLGPDWRFVHRNTMPVEGTRFPPMHVGVLYDVRVFSLESATLHDDTRLEGGRNKPTLEVRLSTRDGGGIFRIFVVHLKAGSEGQPLRARQYQALADILATANGSGERIVALGDFNATDDADRVDLARLAERTGLSWATEALGCSAFWDRDDGCPTSRLDHVLTSATPIEVVAGGACADGCQLRDRCPLYAEQVSDHCPVTVTVP